MSEDVDIVPPCCCVCLKRAGGPLQGELAKYAFPLATRVALTPPSRPLPIEVSLFKEVLGAQLHALSPPLQEAYVMVFKSGQDMYAFKYIASWHQPVVLQALLYAKQALLYAKRSSCPQA